MAHANDLGTVAVSSRCRQRTDFQSLSDSLQGVVHEEIWWLTGADVREVVDGSHWTGKLSAAILTYATLRHAENHHALVPFQSRNITNNAFQRPKSWADGPCRQRSAHVRKLSTVRVFFATKSIPVAQLSDASFAISTRGR